jgi:hypothetical protein
MSQHLILRQIVELDTPASPAEQQVLGDQLSRLARERVPGMLENVLRRFDQPQTHMRLERIVVEIECAAGQALEDALEQHLERAFAAALSVAAQEQGQHQPEERSWADALLHFLRHGHLPWYVEAPVLAAWERRVGASLAEDAGFAGALRALFRQHPPALARLLRHFSDDMPQRVLAALARHWTEADIAALSGQIRALDFPQQVGAWRQLMSETALASPKPPFLTQKPPTAGETGLDTAQIAQAPEPDGEAGIFVENAGAVLLHPFLQRLLEATGCHDGQRLHDPQRALGLLHYAVAGRSTAAEWELPLLKVLCGIPVSEAVPVQFEVSAAQMAEVEALLEALVRHWSVLKNTSNDALRESFLQRRGKLSLAGGHWTLQVEQRAYDLLLEQLPWGIGMLKLPWMPLPLHTIWH